MDKGAKKIINKLIAGTIGVASLLFCTPTFATYYPQECSEHYPAYCENYDDCFAEFGDQAMFANGICYKMGYSYPQEYVDELQALTYVSYDIQSLVSSQAFIANVVGFWLPFGVISTFSILCIYIILLKFKFFK